MADPEPTATQRAVPPDIPADLTAAGFRDVREIGRGGFGAVYRCEQAGLDRTVAVKVLTEDPGEENLERFLREQRAMGRLSGHPHIATVLQVGTTKGGRPYLVMHYHEQGSLEAHIRRHGPLDLAGTLRLGVKLAGALEAAHRVGVLHRDIKPGNILLSAYGEPQLTDFGIARLPGGFQTSTGLLTGSPGFTAPEVLKGAVPTPAADVYGLGATLFCALTGHVAFERRSGEQVMAHYLRVTSHPVADLQAQHVPDEMCAAIERAMAGEAADRPATAAEFGDLLRQVQRRNQLAVDEMALPADAAPESAAASPLPVTQARKTSTAPPTPATKYRPSVRSRKLVARDRLLDVLRAGEGRRLVLIHAPSGFGKSTLAAQWRDTLTGDGMAVAWLTIDNDDNTEAWFLAHLVEAIRTVRSALATELEQVLADHADDAQRYVFTSLIDQLHGADDRLAVVIDDWHRVTDPATIAAMTFLLDNGCHHLQVVVTSWSRSGLPLSRLRVADELVEIDSAALRFDADETRSLLVDVGGLPLSQADVDALTRATDGWVAALQLASLALRGGESPQRLISRMSGSTAEIAEFLAENVVGTLDDTLLDFLLATSITERTCGGLASTLANVTRGRAMLEEVAERGLFLSPIDDERTWYRYHQVFADYLRRRLERERPGEVAGLHRAASAWFADQHLLSEAVDHALAAGDAEHAVDLVEAGQAALLESSKMTTLLGILGKLPPRMVAARPRLQLELAWSTMLLHRRTRSRQALSRFHAALDEATLTDAERADLRAQAAVFEAVTAIFADHTVTVDGPVAEAMARADELPPRVGGAAANVASFAELCRFDFAAARHWQDWGSPYLEQMGPFAWVYGRCLAGLAAKEQLDIAAALDAFQQAIDLAATTAGPHSHMARLAGALLGELRFEMGALTEADRLLDESYQLGSEGGGVDFMIARFATGARVKAAQSDLETAEQRLAAGWETARNLSLPRLAAHIINQRIKLGFGIAPADADRIRAPRDIPCADGIATLTAEIDEDSAVRLMLAEQPDAAYERARNLVRAIDDERRPLAALRANLLLVETLAALGRTDEAQTTLASTAATCDEVGLSGLLLDAQRALVREP